MKKTINKKRCSQCQTSKTWSSQYYYRDRRSQTGFSSTCKVCAIKNVKKVYKKREKQKIPCIVKGCKGILSSHKKYCDKHYLQVKRHGKILKRTIYDRNRIFKRGKYAYISVFNNKQIVVGRVKIDRDDLALVQNYKWNFSNNTIVSSDNGKKYLNMRRLIMKVSKEQILGVKDGNPFHLTKKNIFIAEDQSEYLARPRKKRSTNTSGITGVYWCSRLQCWEVKLGYRNKQYHGGYFDKKSDANESRIELENKYWAESIKII